MDTFVPARHLMADPAFPTRKQAALSELDPQTLDPPMTPLVQGFNRLPFCYTLQSCHGHIIVPGQGPPEHWQRRPVDNAPSKAFYQLAYLALVARCDSDGRDLLKYLAALADTCPKYLQMGCADWFWNTQGQVNSYVLQVCPPTGAQATVLK